MNKFLSIACIVISVGFLIGALYYFNAVKPYQSISTISEAEDLQICIAKDETTEAVRIWQGESGTFFFLPSYANIGNCSFRYDPDCQLVLDGTLIPPNKVLSTIIPVSPASLQRSELAGMHTLTFINKNGVRKDLQNVQFLFSENLPSLFVDTESESLDYIHELKGNREKGHLRIYTANGDINYDQDIEALKGRGNSSWSVLEKKPYQLLLFEENTLLGMGFSDKWCLLNHGFDPTYLRNMVMMDVARESGMPFTPSMQYVDLYMNHEYVGNYLLAQKLMVGPENVDIRSLDAENNRVNNVNYIYNETFGEGGDARKGVSNVNNPADITGGYLIERNFSSKYKAKVSGFVTEQNNPFIIRSPQYASKEEVEYIADVVNTVESAIFSPTDTASTGENLADLVDLDSFADKYVLEEMCLNEAQGCTSAWYYKPQDSVSHKLYAGPAWDYDKTWGNNTDFQNPELLSKLCCYPLASNTTYWYAALVEKPAFKEMVKHAYQSRFRPVFMDVVANRVPAYADYIETSVHMDEYRWPQYHTRDYRDEIPDLVNWMAERITFLDEVWSEDKTCYLIKYFDDNGEVINTMETVFAGEHFIPPMDAPHWADLSNGAMYTAGESYEATRDLNLIGCE